MRHSHRVEWILLGSASFEDVIASVLRFALAFGWVLVKVVLDGLNPDVLNIGFAVNQKLFVVQVY